MSKQATGRVSGKDLIVTRTFKAPIADVWESVTKSERTERWYGKWQGEPGTGKTIQIMMTAEGGGTWKDAVINRCEAPHHLEITSSGPYGSHLELRLSERDGVTELVFTHHLKNLDGVADFGPGWEWYLDRLVADREGAPMPVWDDYYPAQKAHYAAQTK